MKSLNYYYQEAYSLYETLSCRSFCWSDQPKAQRESKKEEAPLQKLKAFLFRESLKKLYVARDHQGQIY